MEPFIAENGGGIFFPRGYRGFRIPGAVERGPHTLIALGRSYAEIRRFVEARKARFAIRGAGDLSLEELVGLTGLSQDQARLARQREFTEPFLLDDDTELAALREEALAAGLKITRGGRFHHLIGIEQDKGRAVRRVAELFRDNMSEELLTVGIGDRPNDFPMLAAVDIPVLMPHPDGLYEDLTLPNLLRAPCPGSLGWNEAVKGILAAWEPERCNPKRKGTFRYDDCNPIFYDPEGSCKKDDRAAPPRRYRRRHPLLPQWIVDRARDPDDRRGPRASLSRRKGRHPGRRRRLDGRHARDCESRADPLLPYREDRHDLPGRARKGFGPPDRVRSGKFSPAKAVAVFDSDLVSITPEWVRNFLDPVFNGYDFVAPYYRRYKLDGTITNTIAYNLTRALYGYRVRQPIGGDFGISQKLAKYYFDQDVWETDVARFGIDVWMTTTAIVGGFKLCQARLGIKVHGEKDPGADLGPMFRQVVGTIFQLMETNAEYWQKVRRSRSVPILGEELEQEPAPFEIGQEGLIDYFRMGYANFSGVWQRIVEERDLEVIKGLVVNHAQGGLSSAHRDVGAHRLPLRPLFPRNPAATLQGPRHNGPAIQRPGGEPDQRSSGQEPR